MTRALAALTVSGVAALAAAAYLWLGLIGALLVYGVFAIAAGLLVDAGEKTD